MITDVEFEELLTQVRAYMPLRMIQHRDFVQGVDERLQRMAGQKAEILRHIGRNSALVWQVAGMHGEITRLKAQITGLEDVVRHDLLSPEELEAMHLLGTFAGKMRRIIGDGPCAQGDWSEACDKIHQLESVVMAQAASRDYPDRYRPLGGRPAPEEASTEAAE